MCDRIGELRCGIAFEEVKVVPNPAISSLLSPYDPIKLGLKLIESNTEKIRQLQEKELNVVTEAGKNEIHASVAALMTETATLGHKLSTTLQAIQVQNANSAEREGDSATQRMRENVYQCQSKQLSRSWEVYLLVCQECQQSFDARHRRQIRCVNQKLTDEQVEQIMSSGQVDAVVKASLISDELKLVVQDIDLRHREILKLERQVLELHELFKDLATLTNLQQEHLDSIEGHVQKARVHTENGEKALQDAAKHQQAARKKKCYLIAGGAVALAAVVVPSVAKASM